MKIKLLFVFCLILSSNIILGQTKKFKIQNHSFIIKSKKVNNEWNTKDDIRKVYLKQNGKEKLVLTYFAYKDEGSDCNNLFWNKEWLKVKGNLIIITTHHFQKTGIDPIPEWERKIYKVNKNGTLKLIDHSIKKYGSKEWEKFEVLNEY